MVRHLAGDRNNAMPIHFLNCGTMRPYFPPVQNGVTCLLVETNQGLVLVDTGLGLADLLHPGRRMRLLTAAMRSPRDIRETALQQVKRLGHSPDEVHHIVMTHLHLDHAGGLPDFPRARVHLYQPEYDHVISGHTGWEYAQGHWAHGPHWSPHQLHGEKWYDFDAIRLEGLHPEIWLVPLVGHSAGHSGVAVRDGRGWVLHAGDALPFNAAVNDVPDWISRALLGPHVPRLRQFMQAHSEVQVVGAHMELGYYSAP
jgi:glyoxylase-like metal-dependent hydrolase (beta-lactamase superfamily II)